jgi:hypothetical protein
MAAGQHGSTHCLARCEGATSTTLTSQSQLLYAVSSLLAAMSTVWQMLAQPAAAPHTARTTHYSGLLPKQAA